jgi:hypothetical protein
MKVAARSNKSKRSVFMEFDPNFEYYYELLINCIYAVVNNTLN